MVINRVSSLDSEERDLVRESFPQLNFDKVLILQEGRKPSSIFLSLGMIVGGVLISLTGVAWFFLGGGS